MTVEVDTLRMALLSMCAERHTPLHAVYAHVEDWLARPIASGEIEQAIGELEQAGLLAAYRLERSEWIAFPLRETEPEQGLRYLTTPEGAAAAFAAWERFFGE